MKTTPNKLYEMQAEICYALSHPIRLHILDLLIDRELKSIELLEILNIPKANLSQHLTVLKDTGLIKSRKDGQCQYVSHALPKIKNACELVRELLIEQLNEKYDEQKKMMNELNRKNKAVNS